MGTARVLRNNFCALLTRFREKRLSIEDANFHDASLDEHEAKCYSSLSVSCQHNGETASEFKSNRLASYGCRDRSLYGRCLRTERGRQSMEEACLGFPMT